ncbi:MAG: G1 family glutamic endopeptidase [Candidatus Saccharimonadales bacterium]
MAVKQNKNTIMSVVSIAPVKKVLKALSAHRTLVLIALMSIVSVSVLTTPTSLKQKEPKIPIPQTVNTKPATKPKPTPVAPPPTTPAPTPQPAPAPTPPPRPVITHTSTPQPVTAPSPGTGVNSLSPTPGSGSGNSGSSGSSTGSSTGTSTPPASQSYTSSNWSGYLYNSGSLTAVSASWVAPSPTGNGTSTSADASWIGIGGVSSQDLIQVGTEDTVSAGGTVSTGAFYELLPAVAQNISGLTVTPGDSISASLSEVSSGQWLIEITDNTDNQTFSTTVSYSSSNSSAEWIEEDPSYTNGQLVPFDNYKTIQFSVCKMTDNGVSVNIDSIGADSVTMVNQQGQNISVPSAISNNGFSATRENF